MFQLSSPILSNECLHGAYHRLTIDLGELAQAARPGQFVQVQIPQLEGHILRRPFSICDVDGTVMTLVYKTVGVGTAALADVRPGTALDILGPLGHGFAELPDDRPCVLLGGGYGCAAMLFCAHWAVAHGKPAPLVLLGARSQADILLEEDFRHLGCQVGISTDDGSYGMPGRITVLLQSALKRQPNAWMAACGPKPMLKAVANLAEQFPDSACQVSLDEIMCCGVGACFGCVIKCKALDTPQGWCYKRSCADGPVFNGSEIDWDG
ncbi:MAG: dihydroorotate dehydrogenase electron transfer subunit [Victivallales bacterium]|nr:dihydroorotate dehydrogenase electron transfer subunit [Victivallales bacterium]